MTFIVDLTLKPSELQGKVVDDVDDFDSETDAKTAEGILLKLNTRKARSPDNICGRLLKLCTSQLSVVFSQFRPPTWSLKVIWSLKENTGPFTWKTSVVCPVPKNEILLV